MLLTLEVYCDNKLKTGVDISLNDFIGYNLVNESIRVSDNSLEVLDFNLELIEVLADAPSLPIT